MPPNLYSEIIGLDWLDTDNDIDVDTDRASDIDIDVDRHTDTDVDTSVSIDEHMCIYRYKYIYIYTQAKILQIWISPVLRPRRTWTPCSVCCASTILRCASSRTATTIGLLGAPSMACYANN